MNSEKIIMRRNGSSRLTGRRLLLAAATLVLGATVAGEATAKQCIYNHFGKSGLIIKVDWYDTGNVVIHHNATENKIEVFSKGGQFAAPTKLQSDTITAGFSSCRNDLASRTAVVSVVGGEIARIAAMKGAAVAGGLVSGVIAGGACAASAGVAIGTAGTGSPAAAVLCIGSGVKAASIGYTVSGVLSNLIPNAKDVVYAGVPSHYNYINIGGTAFDPWYEIGSEIDTKPPILPMPVIYEGSRSTLDPAQLCTDRARERGMRWNGDDPVVIPIGNQTQVMCMFTLPEVFRFIPIQFPKGQTVDLNKECTALAASRGVLYANIVIPKDPINNTWLCRLYG